MGGELLPAAPLQPCAGALSGRGHFFSGWVNLAPGNVFQQQCPPCSTSMGHPLGMVPCAGAPIRWVLSGRWVFIRALPVHSCPLLPTTWSHVFFVRHNIKREINTMQV